MHKGIKLNGGKRPGKNVYKVALNKNNWKNLWKSEQVPYFSCIKDEALFPSAQGRKKRFVFFFNFLFFFFPSAYIRTAAADISR